jgi:hypothetical protein
VVSEESFMVLNSLSKISTISFSKKFKNSWASYIEIMKRVTYGKITLLCPCKVSIILFFLATVPDIGNDWTSLIQPEQRHKIKILSNSKGPVASVEGNSSQVPQKKECNRKRCRPYT